MAIIPLRRSNFNRWSRYEIHLPFSLLVWLFSNFSNSYRVEEGRTPLHYACESENLPLVKFLLANHADPLIKDYHRNTQPLHLACSAGSYEIVQELLARNNTNVNDVHGELKLSPFHFAACAPVDPAIRYLICKSLDKHGAIDKNDHFLGVICKLDQQDREGNLVYNTAASLLRRKRGPFDWIFTSFLCNKLSIPLSESLISYQPTLASHRSVNHCEVVQYLKSPDTYLESHTTQNGITNKQAILRWAIQHSHIDIINKLLDKNAAPKFRADVNSSDPYKITPLMHAVNKGNHEVIRFLLEQSDIHGKAIFINCRDKFNKTALEYALEKDPAIAFIILNELKARDTMLRKNQGEAFGDDDNLTRLTLRHCALHSSKIPNQTNQ